MARQILTTCKGLSTLGTSADNIMACLFMSPKPLSWCKYLLTYRADVRFWRCWHGLAFLYQCRSTIIIYIFNDLSQLSIQVTRVSLGPYKEGKNCMIICSQATKGHLILWYSRLWKKVLDNKEDIEKKWKVIVYNICITFMTTESSKLKYCFLSDTLWTFNRQHLLL